MSWLGRVYFSQAPQVGMCKDEKKLNKMYGEPVHVLEVDTRKDFIKEWNKMGRWLVKT